MASKLPQVGVQAVVLDSDRFFSTMQQMEKQTSTTSDAIQKQADKTNKAAEATDKATKSFNPLAKVLSEIDKQFGGMGSKIVNFTQNLGGAQEGAAAFFGEFPAGAEAIAATAAVAAAAITTFIALGNRGAEIQEVAISFDRLSQAANTSSQALLVGLHKAADGMVSDTNLMRSANLALIGTSGQFAQTFGQQLPQLLQIARVQSDATGRSITDVFNSLTEGIKRASPRMIAAQGLLFDQRAAFETYARSIGVAVSALSEQDKQTAILNATLAAGQASLDAFAGAQESNADKQDRMNAGLTNIVDTLAIGVQPAFGQFLDVINRVIAIVEQVTTAITPLVSSFLDAGAALITGPLNAFLSIIEPIASLVSWLLTLVTVIVQPVLNAIKALGQAVGTGFKQIVDFIGTLINNNLGLNFQNLALNFGRGAGFVFAAFYNAMMEIANSFIYPGVIEIATFIADFLSGNSPPPKGPLSTIDKGGAAVFSAWAEGFAGVGLEPVEQVAADVNTVLGDIGKMSLPAVQARLSQLDAALQPFNDQLAIVKANFEAINEPAKAAMDAIDRQEKKALEALNAGAAGSAEAVRALDAQRDRIQAAVDAQQNLVDQAQIQQALAASQQSQERALLTIQQARLKVAADMQSTADKGVKASSGGASSTAPKAAGGAAGAPSEASGGAAGAFNAGLPSAQDILSGQSQVNQMGMDLGQGFQEGIVAGVDQGQQGALAANQSALNTQVARIQNANISQRLGDAFTNLASGIQVHLQEASDTISDWIDSIINPSRQGSIPNSFTTFITNLPDNLAAMEAAFTGIFDTVSEDVQTWIDDNFGPDNLNSILGNIQLLPTRITNGLSDLVTTLFDSFETPFADSVSSIATNLFNFFVGTGAGSLSYYITQGVNWFIALPGRIFNAIASIGTVFFNAFVTPIIGGINVAIEGVETFINNALSGLGTMIGSLQGLAEAVGFGDQFAEIQGTLAGGINLPRLSLPTAPAPVPVAATGGIFTGGAIRVGERGSEIMSSAASRTAVFPASVTRTLETLVDLLSGGGSMMLPASLNAGAGYGGAGDTYNNQFNMNTPPSSGNAVQQIANLMSSRAKRMA